jgi:uncharacterized protein with NRDE domain
MCTVLFAWRAHPTWPLIVAANRDEARSRPAAAAGFWPGGAGVYGGRDLQADGTWMGISRAGRFAAVTNVREPPGAELPDRSRGALAAAFLSGSQGAGPYATEAVADGDRYGPYNLLVSDGAAMWWASNRYEGPVEVQPGVHGVSNGRLDGDWPKVRRGREGLASWVERGGASEELFGLLADRRGAPDHELPDTGFGLVRERMLAPLFIEWDLYGTRSSTVLLLGADGWVQFEERRFGARGRALGRSIGRWRLVA